MNKNTKLELNAKDMEEILSKAIDRVYIEDDIEGTNDIQKSLRDNTGMLLGALNEEVLMQGIKEYLVEVISNGFVDSLE